MRPRRRPAKGLELHAQFWRRMVLWLAHQEEEEGAAYARPEFRRLPVHGKQSIKVGLRQPGGAEAKDVYLRSRRRLSAPGRRRRRVQNQPVVTDPAGGYRSALRPAAAGRVHGRSQGERKGRGRQGGQRRRRRPGSWLTRTSPTSSCERRPTPTTWRRSPWPAAVRRIRLEDLPGVLEGTLGSTAGGGEAEAAVPAGLAAEPLEGILAGLASPVRRPGRDGVGTTADLGDGLAEVR